MSNVDTKISELKATDSYCEIQGEIKKKLDTPEFRKSVETAKNACKGKIKLESEKTN